jgi:tetratricopeptide (TPR) repeat protein
MAESQRDEIAKLESLYSANPEGRIFTHLAEAYRKAGDLERARETVERGLRRHADYSSAHVVLGRILLDQKDFRGAEEAFRRVLALDPENRVALRAVADLARDDGRIVEALGYYREILLIDPTDEAVEAIARELEAQVGGTTEPGDDPISDPFEAGFDREDGYGYGGGIDFDASGRDPFAAPMDVGGEVETSGEGWVAFEPIDIGAGGLAEGWLDLGSVSLTEDVAPAMEGAALGEVSGGSGDAGATDAAGADVAGEEVEPLAGDAAIEGAIAAEPEEDVTAAWPADAVWSDGSAEEHGAEEGVGFADLDAWRDDLEFADPVVAADAAADAEESGDGEAIVAAGGFEDELVLDDVVVEEDVRDDVIAEAAVDEWGVALDADRAEVVASDFEVGEVVADEAGEVEAVGGGVFPDEVIVGEAVAGEAVPGPALTEPVVADEAVSDPVIADPVAADDSLADEAGAVEAIADEAVADLAVEGGAPAVEEDLRGGEDAFGPVVTETMAELYAGQGLYARAAEVYRELLRGRPDDERLRAKLREAELGDEASRARVAPMAGRPISAYLRGLLGFAVAPREAVSGEVRLGDESEELEATIDEGSDDAILILDESMIVEEAAEEDEFDRLFARSGERNPPVAPMSTETGSPAAGGPSPMQTPSSADPKGSGPGSAGEDDDDLEMFRAWLQNLKR